MPNIRLRLAYDGTEFSGWQIQPERPSIQGILEDAIQKLTGETVRVLSAGRTDAGVHALGQVANFHSNFPIPPHKWRPALQSKLPGQIVILESDEVPAEFHATFSAKSKRYRYVIDNQPLDDPFLRRYVWRISQPLDQNLMRAAARCLVGTHDFRSFESHWPNKATSVRTVSDLTLTRTSTWSVWSPRPIGSDAETAHLGAGAASAARFLVLEIEADGFLYNMVRTIVGTLVNVGRGTWPVSEVERILLAQDRKIAGATAPACGLFLARVNYF